MAEEKKGVLVYADWIDKFEALDDDEAGRLIKHFFRYINDLDPEFPDKLTKISFLDIQNTLKRDLVKWETKKIERSESGSIGNLKRWNLDLYEKYNNAEISLEEALKIAEHRKSSLSDNSESLSSQKSLLTVSVSDSVIVNDNGKVKEKVTNTKKEVKKNSATPTKSIENFKEKARKSFEANNCEFGNNFKREWLELIQTKKWKSKEQSAINASLKLLMKYEEDFSLALIQKAISGGYQGVVFADTDNHYQKYLNSKNGTTQHTANSKAESRNNLANLAREILAS